MRAARGPAGPTALRTPVVRRPAPKDSVPGGIVRAGRRARACRAGTASGAWRRRSMPSFRNLLLDLGNRLGRVQVLRAGFGAVHDRVAAVQAERVLELVQALAGRLVARVDDPTIGGQQGGRAE